VTTGVSGGMGHRLESSAGLDVASLAAQARRRAGVGPEEPLSYLEDLGRLTAAIDQEAGLTATGRRAAHEALLAALTTQLQVQMLWRDHPSIGEIDVQPIFITGLLRTGTTFLQNLLAQHPGLRSPQLWELMAPASAESADKLIGRCRAYVVEYRAAAPAMHAIHPLDACLPEECHRLTGNTFRDPIYALRYHVPSYVRWLREQSMIPSYEFHAAQLRCLLWRRPGHPVVLKGPSHLWHMEALGQVYPGARVIRLHRSPAAALPSVCSLTEVVRRARSDHVDRAEIGRYWLEQVKAVLTGLRRGVGPLRTPPLDIRFSDLADPLAVCAKVCDYIGVPLTDEARTRISAFAVSAEGPRHSYSAADYGLESRELQQGFAGYLREFELEG
jgi:Sulfotransferase family